MSRRALDLNLRVGSPPQNVGYHVTAGVDRLPSDSPDKLGCFDLRPTTRATRHLLHGH